MRVARLRAGLTLAEVGKAVGRTPQAVQQWEKDRSEPQHESLVAFAQLARVNLHWLLTGVVVNDVGGASDFGTSVRGGAVRA